MGSQVLARTLSVADHWGPTTVLARDASDAEPYPSRPAIAVNRHGAATVLWRSQRPRTGAKHVYDLLYGADAAYRRPGHGFSRPQFVARRLVELAVAMNDDGRAYIVGTRSQQYNRPKVYAISRRLDGRWSAEQRISATVGTKPRITIAADGAVVAAWIEALYESDHLQYGPVVAAIATQSGHFAAPRRISLTDSSREAHLIAGSAGETLVSWSNNEEFGKVLEFGRGLNYALRPAGGEFAAKQAVADPDPADEIGDGTVVGLRDGRLFWFSYSPYTRPPRLRLGIRPVAGTFTTPVTIASESWGAIRAASSESIAAVVGTRGRELRLVTVRP